MFKVNNKNTRITSLTSFLCFYCYFWICLTPFSTVFIVDFEQVNFSWVKSLFLKDLKIISAYILKTGKRQKIKIGLGLKLDVNNL